MKHKHAELIKAWADGAEIQARYEKATGWTDWKTEDGGFVWYIGGAEYRIKPEPKPDIVEYVCVEQEPVAWMLTLPDGTHDWILDGNGCKGYIPLYIHPAKTLTDDEIFKTAIENGAYQSKKSGNIYPDDMYILNFARAILKKASEK